MLRFSDGVNIDTSGELRVLHLRDGYYVVGEGICIPVAGRQEAIEIIERMGHTDETYEKRKKE